MNNIVIYGGTFDPPHYGHLNTARAVQHHIHYDRVIFLPCKAPVLKNAAIASSKHRLSMLKLAIFNEPKFEIDTREITRTTPSFMVETLESFRNELGEAAPISLCIGMDAFIQLPFWKSWEKILTLSHLLVMKRAKIDDKNRPESLNQLLLDNEIVDPCYLRTEPHGKIYCFDAGQYAISSSWLREQIQAGKNIEEYLPASVYEYIKSKALYPAYPSASY